MFLFAFVNGVEPTNNAAERALRHGVLWRKMSHGTKSVKGSEYLACIWSVVETCRQQERGVWDFLTDCMAAAAQGRSLPSFCTFCDSITLFIDAAGCSRCHSLLKKLPE